MRYYPVNLDIANKRCVIVGGGDVSLRKVESLLSSGAKVTVISPELNDGLKELLKNGEIAHVQRIFQAGDTQGASLVIGATDDERVNESVFREASESGTLVNIVDDPQKCNFTVPSTIIRGDLTITISTGGKSPALAKRIRQELENNFGPEYETFLDLMGAIREQILKRSKDSNTNKEIFERLIYSDILQLIRDGHFEKVEKQVEELVGENIPVKPNKGKTNA